MGLCFNLSEVLVNLFFSGISNCRLFIFFEHIFKHFQTYYLASVGSNFRTDKAYVRGLARGAFSIRQISYVYFCPTVEFRKRFWTRIDNVSTWWKRETKWEQFVATTRQIPRFLKRLCHLIFVWKLKNPFGWNLCAICATPNADWNLLFHVYCTFLPDFDAKIKRKELFFSAFSRKLIHSFHIC